MRRSFWKATAISVGAYAGALALGFLADFRLTLFLLMALQVTWTLFCIVRLLQLRRAGAHASRAERFDREAYSFAAGGSISSITLLCVVVVLTQIV
jgi:hypothetical protein